MVAVAVACGKLADRWGRKHLFLIGFTVLALRNGLTVVSHDQYYLISLQALDGVAMGIYGVLLTLITADLAKGTGRFNLLQGMVQSSMGLGGVLSNGIFGWTAKALGFQCKFLGIGGGGDCRRRLVANRYAGDKAIGRPPQLDIRDHIDFNK